MLRALLASCLLLACGLSAAARDNDFAQPPVQALESLTRLKHLSAGRPAATADEKALFADAADGRLDRFSFAEAALIASGVTDAKHRRPYLERIDQLEAGLRQEVAALKTPAEKGEKLLGYLHAGPLKGGYATKQSSLAEVLDSGKFNCVSSAVLYNIMAQRIGLDARGVLVFGHAFSVVHDGAKAMDVETTNRRGFNPRDPDVLKEIAEKTGRKPASGPRDRREVRELGLVASIYSNRSADASAEKDYYESLLCGFAALALYPDSDTGAQNARAGLANWSKYLVETRQFETALTVIAVGREIAPKDFALRANRQACWQDWLQHCHDKDGEESARRLAVKMLADHPGDRELAEVARSYAGRQADRLRKSGQYREALASVARNRDLLGEREATNLKAYCWQEWLKATPGEEAARKLIVQLCQDHPNDRELADVVRGHVIRGMNPLKQAGKYEDALAFVARHAAVLPADQVKQLRVALYDAWAFSYRPGGKWQAGIEVYRKALQEYPGDSHLSNNLKFFEQEARK